MDAIITLHFVHQKNDDHPYASDIFTRDDSRHFAVKLDVELGRELINIINIDDDDFSERFYDFQDYEYESYIVMQPSSGANMLGWLTFYNPEDNDAEFLANCLKKFIASVGLNVVDMVEIPAAGLQNFLDTDQTQALLVAEIEKQYPGRLFSLYPPDNAFRPAN